MANGLTVAIILVVMIFVIMIGWALANIGAILITFVIGVVVGWVSICYVNYSRKQPTTGDTK